MEAAYGEDAAASLLHHKPKSDTYRRSYDRGIEKYDLFGIATGEKETQEPTKTRGSALNRVIVRKIDREAFIISYVAEDPDVREAQAMIENAEEPTVQMTKDLKAAHRRACYHGQKAADIAEKEITESDMTVEDFKQRIEELKKPTSLQASIQNIARNAPSAEELEDEREIRIADPSAPPEVLTMENDTDEIDDSKDLYSLFEALMVLLPSRRIKPGEDRDCFYCEEDDTIDQVFKATNAANMKRHLNSRLHIKRSHWTRSHQSLLDSSENGLIECPYGCRRKFSE
jgi:hypothetical protein